jgi:hypothetical protein
MKDLARNLVAGVRLALFLPVRAEHFRASPQQFALLAAFNFVVWVAAAALRAGFEGDFDPVAIAVYLSTVALVLATALLVAMLYRAPEKLLLAAVALSASDLVFELAAPALPVLADLAGDGRSVYLGFLGWGWLASMRAVVVCFGWRRPQLYGAALVVAAMTAAAFYLIPKTDVWLGPDEDEEPPAGLIEERLFHMQGELIERELQAIEPGRPGQVELYFVGFAPDASQDVFLNELRFAKRLFDERFRTAGRSIALASSHTALDQVPIGSTTNLMRALRRVGQAMNAEEDILFLFITAHGDREHRLSASQPPLELASLTPSALARMLQDSGVKWRVIVISACYAGGFIEPLRDDNTVVISAAAADRTSFGCESGRDFTYFGEAYFRDALAGTRSFTDAFEAARDSVAKKEAAGKLEPSLPQMWTGAAIAARLKDFSDQPDKQRQ